MNVTRNITMIRMFSLRVWVVSQIELITASAFAWAFSLPKVQYAIVDQIKCGTPIGNALVRQMEDVAENSKEAVELDDIRGLDRAIEVAVEEALDEAEVEAENVKNLDNVVSAILENHKEFQEELVDAVCQEIAKKLK